MENPPGALVQESLRMEPKHDKVHLLIISETGRVKSRKISLRFVRYFVIVFVLLFILTSLFSYLYWHQYYVRHVTGDETATLLKEIDHLHARVEEQDLEINRLRGVVGRLKRENKDLKRRIITKKAPGEKAGTPVKQSVPDKKSGGYRKFLSYIETLKIPSKVIFQIRDPKIAVSPHETQVSFKLYKDTLKKVYGRYILLGIYRPEDSKKAGKVVAYPSRSVSNFNLRPGYGRPFKIERRFLTVTAKLTHPEGIEHFSEFHIFVFGVKKEVVFHERFKAP